MKLAAAARPRALVHVAIVAMFASVLTVAFSTEALAATITVEVISDVTAVDGDCTLREAVDNANDGGTTHADCTAGAVGVDTINFSDETATYVLTGANNEDANVSGDLDILTDVIIVGGAADETFIDGGGGTGVFTCDTTGGDTDDSDRVFHVVSGSLTLQDLTVQNGRVEDAVAGDELGGGIWNQDELTLESVQVQDNYVCASDTDDALGGGIAHSGTDLTIRNSAIVDNATLAPNAGVNLGGGIWADEGGGIVNSTISGNDAEEGGGIYFDTGAGTDLLVTYVTIYDNDQEGVTALTGGGSQVVFGATIVANNPDPEDDCTGAAADFVTEGYNLSSDDGCDFDDTGDDREDDDPDLDNDLDDNDGETVSHMPDDDSVVVDDIPTTDCDDFSMDEQGEDQRDEDRPDDGSDDCDIGAIELTEDEQGGGSSGGSGSSSPNDELDATPETATNTLPGDLSHTVTVDFDEDELDIDDEDQVDFNIISGPNVRGDSDEPDFECSLASDVCSITYTSNGVAGTDVICAWMDTDDDANYSTSSSSTDGGNCDTEAVTPSSTSDNDFTDVVQKTWAVATTTTTTTTTTPSSGVTQCNDGRDNDSDTYVDFPRDPGCSSAADNSEGSDQTPVTVRVGTAASLFFKGRTNTFRGDVLARRRRCQSGRVVTLKRVDRGPDTPVGRDISARDGRYRIPAFGRPNGRFYAKVARKVFTARNGNRIICLGARSRRVTV